MADSKKVKILPQLLKRLLSPHHLWKVIQLQRNRKRVARVYDDAQLKLYHKIMPGDFLHYGYFEQANVEPIDITLRQIYEAQLKYAEQIIDLISDKQNTILDIGCGMGGLLKVMNSRQLNAIGLTPDKNQAEYIRRTYPNTLIESRFEDLDGEQYKTHFGTVLTSESLQYLQLDIALPLVDKILKQGGKWISCDYFKIGAAGERSGHNYNLFLEKLKANGFKISYERDITLNILPTIAYVHHWATQILMPLKQFGLEKMQVKAPGFYYALQSSLPQIEEKINKNIATIDPTEFKANKRYVLMVIERV
jgi:cyclopropane fatty-acyl-phospholipid synthase-like methyltransferase